ncbi:MAG: hypothetical protein P8X43_05205 [Maritimibacter sp.]
MKSNVIAFDRVRKTTRSSDTDRPVADSENKVVSLMEWKTRTRTRRTASGVYFTTGILATWGGAA